MARIELSNIGGGGGGGSTTLALTTTGTSGASVLTTVPGGYSLNIPVYQGALSLSTAGTSGASTLVGDTLTIPTYQGQISLTTTGTSGASTFVGNTLNIPTYQGAISLTTTGTSGAATLVGNTLNVPQYSTAPAGSTGEIQYNNAGAFAASANLAWDNTNVRLNIGAPSAPAAALNVRGGGTTIATATQIWTNSSNTELMRINDAGKIGIGGAPDASVPLTIYSGGILIENGNGIVQRTQTGTSFFFNGGTLGLTASGTRGITVLNTGTIISNSTANLPASGQNCIIRGRSTAASAYAVQVQNSTPDNLYQIENNGKISYWATNTAAGTTGAQTINRPSGTVNFGIGAGSLVVTNSLCTTSSIVFATVRTNDATAYIKNVVPAAGSFTINLGAAATAEASVGFFIIN